MAPGANPIISSGVNILTLLGKLDQFIIVRYFASEVKWSSLQQRLSTFAP
jgi:hypothetical protein